MMAANDAGESATFADAYDVNKLFAIENVYQDALANLQSAVALSFFLDFDGHLADEFHGRQIVLPKMSLHRLRQARLFHELNEPDLRGGVSVASLAFVLRDYAGAGLQDCGGMHLAPVIEQLSHADFLS
jgi:hypothetical protein